MFAKYAYRRELTSNLFPEFSPFREDPSKALITIPLKFKFVFEARPLSSPAFSLSNHVPDGVELIRMGMGFQLQNLEQGSGKYATKNIGFGSL